MTGIMRIAGVVLLLLAAVGVVSGGDAVVDSVGIAKDINDINDTNDVSVVDVVDVLNTDNTTTADDDDDDLKLADLLIADTANSAARKPPELIRREHDYRRQTKLAIWMMVFIAAALASSQSWNPR